MKYFSLFIALLFSATITFSSCNEEKKTPKKTAPKAVAAPAAMTSAEPAQNAKGVWHYTCMKGCPGGSGTSSNCTNCGMALVHNQAYHTNSAPSSAPFANPNAMPGATAEPAQNAQGVWHYTCTEGCAGGSGSAGNCRTCGNTLAHNSTYHQ